MFLKTLSGRSRLMRKIKVYLGLAALLVLPAGAFGQQVDLVEIRGNANDSMDSIAAGQEVTFVFDWNNSGSTTITGWTCGFRFGLTSGSRTRIETDTAWYFAQALDCAGMDGNQNWTWFGWDGEGEDTIALSAYRIFGPGLPAGAVCELGRFSVIVDYDAIGETFCIDSCGYPPSQAFLWTDFSGGVEVGWEGPHCFTVYKCCQGMRGNADGDPEDVVNIVDLNYVVTYLFGPPDPPPPCFDEGDVNADGAINIIDLTYLVDYLFGIPPGSPPAACP